MLRHRLVSAAAFLVMCVAVGGGAAFLRVDFSARAFFGGDDDGLRLLDRHQAEWGADDALLVVTAEARAGTVLERARLDEVKRVAAAVEALPGVKRTVGLHNVRLPRREGGALAFRAIADALPDDEGERRAFVAGLLNDPMVVPMALASDGRATAVVVELAVPPDDIAAVRPVVLEIERIILGAHGAGLSFAVAGVPVVRAKLLELILGDQTSFVPVAFVVMALLLLLLFRRFHGVVLPLLVAAIPAGLVMGVMGYAGEPIGVINQVYFTLLPVIAVSGGIHFLSRYYEEAHRIGAHHTTLLPVDRKAAVIQAVRFVGGACLFSYLTTVIGLLSLQVSSMPILRSFGLYSAVGVAFAWITLVVLVPLILSVTRGRVLDPERAVHQARVNALLERCARVSAEGPWRVVVIFLLFIAGACWLGTRVVVDNSVSGMLRADHPARVAGTLVDERLAGLISLEITLGAAAGAFDDPGVLGATLALEERLRALDDVRVVQGPAGVVARAHEALVGERSLPATRELAAQLSFLQEGSGFYDALLSEDRRRARVVVRTADIGGRRFAALETRVASLVAAWSARPEVKAQHGAATITGTASLQYSGVNRLAEDLRLSLITAWGVILVTILLIFRSVRVALISVLPNAVPLVAGYGLIGLLGWPLEPGPAVVLVVALGIAVDDTIHILARTAEASRDGLSLHGAVKEALVHTGRPVVMTSVILAAGFAVNMLSAFPNNARVGALGAFVIAVALLGDLFLLPALMVLCGERAFARDGGAHDDDSLA